jgi:hypothetical protein
LYCSASCRCFPLDLIPIRSSICTINLKLTEDEGRKTEGGGVLGLFVWVLAPIFRRKKPALVDFERIAPTFTSGAGPDGEKFPLNGVNLPAGSPGAKITGLCLQNPFGIGRLQRLLAETRLRKEGERLSLYN